MRADRWYKLWRSILYGSLEDESPFNTVRRLVTYEDYALRLLQDVGVRAPTPHSVVEIPPEREYLLVTEFLSGAVEIGEADVDDEVIERGCCWSASCGTPGSPTATLSPATSWSATGSCC